MKTTQATGLAALVAVSFTTLATASSICSLDVANPWPTGSDSCNGDVECEALALEGQCNAQALIDGSTCVKVKRDDSLVCSDIETCFLYTDGDLLCLDASTGEYHDERGGYGNALSGVYTAANGNVQTVTGTEAGTVATAAATTASDALSSGMTRVTATGSSLTTSASVADTAYGTSITSAEETSSQTSTAAAVTQTGGAAHPTAIVKDILFAVAAAPVVFAMW